MEHVNGRLLALMSSPTDHNLNIFRSAVINRNLDLANQSDSKNPEISEKADQLANRYPDISTFTRHPGDFGVIHELEVFDEGIVLYHTPIDKSGNR